MYIPTNVSMYGTAGKTNRTKSALEDHPTKEMPKRTPVVVRTAKVGLSHLYL